jgi:hypothetical protein
VKQNFYKRSSNYYFSILPHPHAFRKSRLGPASSYLASLATVTGSVNTDRISYLGCALRTARLNDDCRPHPTTVAAAPHYPHTRPPDVHACLAYPKSKSLSNTYSSLALRSSPSVWNCLEDPRHPYPLEQIFVVVWIGVSQHRFSPSLEDCSSGGHILFMLLMVLSRSYSLSSGEHLSPLSTLFLSVFVI